MAPTRVLLLVNSFTRGGGAERLAIDLARSTGVDLRYVVCAVGGASSEEAVSIRGELARQGVETATLAGSGRLGRIRMLADVVRMHQIDLAHLHVLSLAALPLIPLRIPYIYTFHAETLGGRSFHALEIALARSARRAIVVSQAMVEVAQRRTRIPRERLVVIANGVDVERLRRVQTPRAELRARYGIPGDARLVTVLARLDRNKRQDVVLDAVARLDARTHVMLAGSLTADPHWVAGLRARADALRLGARVHFPGIVADAPSLLGASDVLVAASESESFGIAPVEGMIAGVPVVMSDIPAHREISDAGRRGRLFPVGDAAALACALGGTTGIDLTQVSLEAARRYGMDRVVREHADLYRAVR